MKNKTQKRVRGGNNMKLLVTVNAQRLQQFAGGPGGSLKGEVYTNTKGDVKIAVYQIVYGDYRDSKPSELLLKSIGTIPDNAIQYYKLAFEDKMYSSYGILEMTSTLEKLTRLIVSTHTPIAICETAIVKCETDLETCNNKNREISNENQTLINKLAKLPLAFSE